MNKIRSVLVFSDWQTLFQNLSDEQAGQLIKAMCFYNKGEEYTPSDPTVTAMFSMVKEGMDHNSDHYDKVCQRRAEAGKKGADKRWKDGKSHSENGKCHSEDGKTCKSESVTLTESESVTLTESESVIPPTEESKSRTRKRFRPPTVEEVEAYCFERNNKVDAERFVDYSTANGWKVGKNPMKDWKAAVRNWERKDPPDNVVSMTKGQQARAAQNEVLKAMYQGLL